MALWVAFGRGEEKKKKPNPDGQDNAIEIKSSQCDCAVIYTPGPEKDCWADIPISDPTSHSAMEDIYLPHRCQNNRQIHCECA